MCALRYQAMAHSLALTMWATTCSAVWVSAVISVFCDIFCVHSHCEASSTSQTGHFRSEHNTWVAVTGNITADSRAGIQIIDFSTGDSLQLTGHGRVLWDERALPGVTLLLEWCSFHCIWQVFCCSYLETNAWRMDVALQETSIPRN